MRVPEPFDFELSTQRFRAFGPDLANLWHDGALHRVFDGREVRLDGSSHVDGAAAQYLGAGWDLEAFSAFAASDPVLAPLAERLRGFRPPLVPDPFEALVTSITAQQISLVMAFRVRNRLIERFGRRVGEAWEFPRQEAVAAAEPDELFALGFTRRKAEYVVGLARADLPYEELAALPDDEVKARIVTVRGLGEWTADWYLARHLARPEAWPVGDLGLRKAALHFYGLDVHELGPRLTPFQNLVAHYLLTGLRVAP